MRRWLPLALALAAAVARADDFDRVEGPVLASIPALGQTKVREILTLKELGNLPNIFRGTRSAFLVVKTDQGNLGRLLVAPAFRKPRDEAAEPVPILVLDRFDAFELPGAARRLAHGKDLSLYDGFRFDLDTGQVVPEGQGGDLQFLAKDEGGPRLVALPGATIFTLDTTPLPAVAGANRPSTGRAVVPADFSGRYRLFSNGQATGLLDITVTDGDVSGKLRSDQTGTSYPLSGETGSPANRIRFTVELPRTKQIYEGFLFTEGKGAIAGVTTLLERSFGFFAIREGGVIVPEGEELERPVAAATNPGRVDLALNATGGFVLDGEDLSREQLAERLRAAIEEEPATWVFLKIPTGATYEAAARAIELVRSLGIDRVRLATPGER